MNRRLPSWIALAASGVLAVASAFAQGGGDNPRPSGDAAGTAHPSSGDTRAGAMQGAEGKAGKPSARHAKAKKAKAASTSSAGTAAARGSFGAAMSRCTSMTDRRERADCARDAWEREHGRAG